jgi:hypothetical protein
MFEKSNKSYMTMNNEEYLVLVICAGSMLCFGWTLMYITLQGTAVVRLLRQKAKVLIHKAHLRRGAAKKSPSGAPCGVLFSLARRGVVRYHKNVWK